MKLTNEQINALSEQNESLRDMLKACFNYINSSHSKGVGDKVDILRDIHQVLRETSRITSDK